jgi:hypothetical protein
MTWTKVANCLRCGAPIYILDGPDKDFPEMRYTCHCWDAKPGHGWVTNVTEKVTDKVDKR